MPAVAMQQGMTGAGICIEGSGSFLSDRGCCARSQVST